MRPRISKEGLLIRRSVPNAFVSKTRKCVISVSEGVSRGGSGEGLGAVGDGVTRRMGASEVWRDQTYFYLSCCKDWSMNSACEFGIWQFGLEMEQFLSTSHELARRARQKGHLE